MWASAPTGRTHEKLEYLALFVGRGILDAPPSLELEFSARLGSRALRDIQIRMEE